MLHVLGVLLPVFGLILCGFVGRRTGRLGDAAAAELNRFVVWLCLPALLFRVTATATLEEIWHPGFIGVVTLSTLAIFTLTLLRKLKSPRHLVDASIDGLSAAYANTGYVGIPLCLLVLGDEGLQPALVATLIVVCILFAIAVACIEIGLQAEQSLHLVIGKVLLALLKNPLVISPLVGAGWAVAGLGIAEPAVQFLTLLGDATTPCALVSLGAFLAQKQQKAPQGTLELVLIKLILHPLLAWVLAFHVFQLPPLWAKAAVLLCALPTGTGPFMLAEYYQREASLVSRSILFSTLGSLLTLSVCLLWVI